MIMKPVNNEKSENNKWNYTNFSKVISSVKENFPYENPREMQLEVTSEIMDAVEKGFKFIILEAEAGFGKSAVAATLTKLFDTSYILTPTKQLQNQYLEEFKDHGFALIKGRNAYTCLLAEENGENISCDEGYCLVGDIICSYKNSRACEYINARKQAEISETVITNYDYFYFEQNVNTYSNNFFKKDLLILDEAHKIRDKMAKHLTLHLNFEDLVEDTGLDISSEDLIRINENVNLLVNELVSRYQSLKVKSKMNNSSIFDNDRFINLNNYSFNEENLKNLLIIQSNLEDEHEYEIDIDETKNELSFIPLDLKYYANDVLLKYADVCVFMSATILNKDLFIKELGIDESEVYAIRVNNTFNPKRNPIVVFDDIMMNQNSSERYCVNLKKAIETIKCILELHDEKGIIHTISYNDCGRIMASIENDRLISHDRDNRVDVINYFKNADKPLVLVSPALNEGVDFPYDECRFQIILKVPFVPSKNKDEDIKIWYDATINFIELHGRGLRAPDDNCITYVTDCRLKNFIKHDERDRERCFFPQYIKDAVKYGDDLFKEE